VLPKEKRSGVVGRSALEKKKRGFTQGVGGGKKTFERETDRSHRRISEGEYESEVP